MKAACGKLSDGAFRHADFGGDARFITGASTGSSKDFLRARLNFVHRKRKVKIITSDYIKLAEDEFQRLVGHAHRHRWMFRIVCFVLGPAAAIYGLSNNPTGSVWSLALTLLGGAVIGGAIGDIRSTRRYGTNLISEQDKVYGDARALSTTTDSPPKGRTVQSIQSSQSGNVHQARSMRADHG